MSVNNINYLISPCKKKKNPIAFSNLKKIWHFETFPKNLKQEDVRDEESHTWLYGDRSFWRPFPCLCVLLVLSQDTVVSDSVWPQGLQAARLLCLRLPCPKNFKFMGLEAAEAWS